MQSGPSSSGARPPQIGKLFGYRGIFVIVAHGVLVALGYALAFLARFDFRVPSDHWNSFLVTLPLLMVVRLIVFDRLHLYQGMWRYVSIKDFQSIIWAVSLSGVIFAGLVMGLYGYGDFGAPFPRSVFLLDWMLCTALVAGIRIGIRELREVKQGAKDTGRRILIVGAGDAGQSLLRYLNESPYFDYKVVGLIDDDPRKRGIRVHGIRVLGTSEQMSSIVSASKADEVIVAVPSAVREHRRRILKRCLEAEVPVKTVPSRDDLENGRARIGQLQAVDPQDLLPRQAVQVDVDRLLSEISGRRVLVTGAAGSIGSEICRQVATLGPEMLVLYEQAESPLYFVEIDLRERFRDLKLVPVVGDILDRPKVAEVMRDFAPEVVFHAAAYKHVPLMEAQPLEAIQNNVFGTESIATAAIAAGVRKMVNISTDKAVRPVGVMGMTKRVAEDLLISLQGQGTTFVSVRFGNVLGSAGSVIPLFQKQIAQGGPVTVTDPEATRYFMVISEAAQLVLQAGAMAKGGEVFFLDMGEPMRIGKLAKNLVRLAGMRPGEDIGIESIGLRPGERMNEELIRETEELLHSEHEKVFYAKCPEYDTGAFAADYETLKAAVDVRDTQLALKQLRVMAARF